jgi:hypothetical protein
MPVYRTFPTIEGFLFEKKILSQNPKKTKKFVFLLSFSYCPAIVTAKPRQYFFALRYRRDVGSHLISVSAPARHLLVGYTYFPTETGSTNRQKAICLFEPSVEYIPTRKAEEAMQRLLNLGGTHKKGVVGSGKKRRPLGSKRAALWETCDDHMNKIGEYAILLSKGLGAMLTMEAVAMACCTIISIFLVSHQVLDITFQVEFAIFAAGCIFPLTFNVGAAFNRREAALECLSNLKANIFAIYFHFSSFDLTGTGKAEEDALHIFQRLVSNIETHLRGSREDHAGLVWGDTSPIQVNYVSW